MNKKWHTFKFSFIIFLISLLSVLNCLSFNKENRKIYPVEEVIGSTPEDVFYYPLGSQTNLLSKALKSLFKATEERYALAFNLTNYPPVIKPRNFLVGYHFNTPCPSNHPVHLEEYLELIDTMACGRKRRYFENDTMQEFWHPPGNLTSNFWWDLEDTSNFYFTKDQGDYDYWGYRFIEENVKYFLRKEVLGGNWEYWGTNIVTGTGEWHELIGVNNVKPYLKMHTETSLVNPSLHPSIRIVENFTVPELINYDKTIEYETLLAVNQIEPFSFILEKYITPYATKIYTATGYPSITKNTFEVIDNAIFEMTPKFVSTNQYNFDNGGYSNWFNSYYVDIFNNTNYPSGYPWCSAAEIMDSLQIGFTTNLVYDNWGHVTDGLAYFTKMPEIEGLKYRIAQGYAIITNELFELEIKLVGANNKPLDNIYYGTNNIYLEVISSNDAFIESFVDANIRVYGKLLYKPTQAFVYPDAPNIYSNINIGINILEDININGTAFSGPNYVWQEITNVVVDLSVIEEYFEQEEGEDKPNPINSVFTFYLNQYELFSKWPEIVGSNTVDNLVFWDYEWDGAFYQLYIPHIEERVEYLDALKFTTKPWDGWTNHVGITLSFADTNEHTFTTNVFLSTNKYYLNDHSAWLYDYNNRFSEFTNIYVETQWEPSLFIDQILVSNVPWINISDYTNAFYLTKTNMVLPKTQAPVLDYNLYDFFTNKWLLNFKYGYYKEHNADWESEDGLQDLGYFDFNNQGEAKIELKRNYNIGNYSLDFIFAEAYSKPVSRYATNIGERIYWRTEEIYLLDDDNGQLRDIIYFDETRPANSNLIIWKTNLIINIEDIDLEQLVQEQNSVQSNLTRVIEIDSEPHSIGETALEFPEIDIDDNVFETNFGHTGDENGYIVAKGTNYLHIPTILGTNFHIEVEGVIPQNTNLALFNGIYYLHETHWDSGYGDYIFSTVFTNENNMAIGVETNNFNSVALGWEWESFYEDLVGSLAIYSVNAPNHTPVDINNYFPVTDKWGYWEIAGSLYEDVYNFPSAYTEATTNISEIIADSFGLIPIIQNKKIDVNYFYKSAFSTNYYNQDHIDNLTDEEFINFLNSQESRYGDYLKNQAPVSMTTVIGQHTYWKKFGPVRAVWDDNWVTNVPFNIVNGHHIIGDGDWDNPSHPDNEYFPSLANELWLLIDPNRYYSLGEQSTSFGWLNQNVNSFITGDLIITHGHESDRHFIAKDDNGYWFIYIDTGTDVEIYRSSTEEEDIWDVESWVLHIESLSGAEEATTTQNYIEKDDDKIRFQIIQGGLAPGSVTFNYANTIHQHYITDNFTNWVWILDDYSDLNADYGTINDYEYEQFEVKYRYSYPIKQLNLGFSIGPYEMFEQYHNFNFNFNRNRIFPLPVLLKWDIEDGLEYYIR